MPVGGLRDFFLYPPNHPHSHTQNSMLPDALKEALAPHVEGAIRTCASVGGGCIAHACRLETEAGAYFLKWGRGDVARTFPCEAAGLEALRAAKSALVIPEVIAAEGETPEAPGFLLLPWVQSGRRREGFWTAFGEGLAQMHRHVADRHVAGRNAAERYGFAADNFIGSTPQANDWRADWPDFFRTQRLAPQVRLAREQGRWSARWKALLEALYDRLPDLLPVRPEASVLHGDLWSGNVMVSVVGAPVLIDPAAYYGHREADLAMTELFGGFRPAFYDAYRSAWPLEPGYDERCDVYNLYHLVNHLNLFGRSYAPQVERILRRFG